VQSSRFKVQSFAGWSRRLGWAADCQSAAQQISNLRYAPRVNAPTLPTLRRPLRVRASLR
ncbi:MAG: hypothetical protein RMK20_11495, partial [Verrucomicrobiales bacterium]|nr:hypothetical protein [Verrucomicrobiales bacterium]